MSDQPSQLTHEQILALKYAAHRQLARWAKSRPLPARHQACRNALIHAVRTLQDPAYTHGCQLHPASHGG
jgi:hypothetical protein